MRQYYYTKPGTNEVHSFSSDEISKNPQLQNGLVLISRDKAMSILKAGKDNNIELVKEKQLAKVSASFKEVFNNSDATVSVPGIGFVNATRDDLANVTELLGILEAEGSEATLFRLYNNDFVEITIEQLRNIKLQIAKRGKSLYEKKWKLEQAILAATTIREVESINW